MAKQNPFAKFIANKLAEPPKAPPKKKAKGK